MGDDPTTAAADAPGAGVDGPTDDDSIDVWSMLAGSSVASADEPDYTINIIGSGVASADGPGAFADVWSMLATDEEAINDTAALRTVPKNRTYEGLEYKNQGKWK